MAGSAFDEVHCPTCNYWLMRIATGLSEVQCRRCKHIVTVGREKGGAVRIIGVRKNLTRAASAT